MFPSKMEKAWEQGCDSVLWAVFEIGVDVCPPCVYPFLVEMFLDAALSWPFTSFYEARPWRMRENVWGLGRVLGRKLPDLRTRSRCSLVLLDC